VEEHVMSSRYYHYDGLGSAQLLTDESGNVTDSYCNTAYGQPVDTGAANPTINPFQFVGQAGYYLDANTGNYYVRARTYSPTIARWLSEDPIGHNGGINLYVYISNVPLADRDPEGTISEKECEKAKAAALNQMKAYVDAMHRRKPKCNLVIFCRKNNEFPCTRNPDLAGGTYTENVGPLLIREISICFERADSELYAQQTAAHEIVHAFDACSGCYSPTNGRNKPAPIKENECYQLACTEIRAASISGQCAAGSPFRTKLQQLLQQKHPGLVLTYDLCVKMSAFDSLQDFPACEKDASNVINNLYGKVPFIKCSIGEREPRPKPIPWPM
jgi:RHS repeat-associated protein